jgi:glycosyltransferase involved in cell wall biosynthesis
MRASAAQAEREDRRARRRIIARYLRRPWSESGRAFPSLYQQILDSRAPADVPTRFDHPANSDEPSFALVTCLSGSAAYFEATSGSVEAAIAAGPAGGSFQRAEWVVVSDVPDASAEILRAQIPPAIRDRVTILSQGRPRGVVACLNQAIGISRGEWIVFLGCADLIEPGALQVLARYAQDFPISRYIGSLPIDMDEKGQVLRRRRIRLAAGNPWPRPGSPGGLIAVRRDLFAELGGLEEDTGEAYDDALALGAYFREPVLTIPEHLCRLRWHGGRPLVQRPCAVQEARNRVQRDFVLRMAGDAVQAPPSLADGPRAVPAPARMERGACIVRTQGRRGELLIEALGSIEQQSLQTRPVVVVHGSERDYRDVAGLCAARAPTSVCLHAGELDRRRGYPANLGLDYALQHRNDFDFVCFLDDDDILYPQFAERMAAALSFGQVDMVYARANRRRPWHAPTGGHLPLPTACLLLRNFLPINAFCLSLESLAAAGVRFDETMEYLEDWDFLLSLLDKGLHIMGLPEALSEFRLIGDGNMRRKKEPRLYRQCRAKIARRCEALAMRLGPAFFHRSIGEFDFSNFAPAELQEIEHVVGLVQRRFERQLPQENEGRGYGG